MSGQLRGKSVRDHRSKIVEPAQVPAVLERYRQEGLKIVSLNGSFDLLHAGHLEMVKQAKQQGDILVVALNTDESIRRYKSAQRPIVPLLYRMELMAALEGVDLVTYFSELNPIEILKLIRPDVHVNGAEYGADCVEAPILKELNARLHLVERIPGLATSAIITKIKSLCD